MSGVGRQKTIAVDLKSSRAGEHQSIAIAHGKISIAEDGHIEWIAGGFDRALREIERGATGNQSAAERLEQVVAVAAMAGELRFGALLFEKGQIFFKANRFRVGQVVGNDVLPLRISE